MIPINPHEREIEGLQAYASVLDVPGRSTWRRSMCRRRSASVSSRRSPPSRSGSLAEPGAESDALSPARGRLSIRPIVACSIVAIGQNPYTLYSSPDSCSRERHQPTNPMSSQQKPRGPQARSRTRARRRRRRPDRRPAPRPPAPAQTAGLEHHRSEGHEHPEAHADRQGHDRRRRDRHAQTGADLPDPEGADRAERLHLLRGRARSAARRVRLSPRARLQLPARARTTSTSRRRRSGKFDLQTGDTVSGQIRPPKEGRALLRADQGRGGQLRGARTRRATSSSSKTSRRSTRRSG